MGYSRDRAAFESALARAHRALHQAEEAAEGMRSPGDVEDVNALKVEVLRLAEASLKDRGRQARYVDPGQMKLA